MTQQQIGVARTIGALTFAMVALCAPGAYAQVDYNHFSPDILTATSSGSFLLEASCKPATVTAVVESIPGLADRSMRDDGLDGDKVAGDKVFTATFTAAELQTIYGTLQTPLRPKVVTIGTVRARNAGARSLGTLPAAIPYRTSSVPTAPLTSISATMQATPSVVNIVLPRTQLIPLGATFSALDTVTTKFYQEFRDSFHFINIVYDNQIRNALSYHWGVQNQTSGLGMPIVGLDSKFGSASSLLGITQFNQLAVLEGARHCGYTFLHETAHQWMNLLAGQIDDPINAHWPPSDLIGGVLGLSNSFNGQGVGLAGTESAPAVVNDTIVFTATPTCFKHLDMEKYLMGLQPAAQVATHMVSTNTTQTSLDIQTTHTVLGPLTPVTIGHVTSANGARSPAYPNATRSFRVATILVTADTKASSNLMSWAESEANYLGAAFTWATDGAGRMVSDVLPYRKPAPMVSLPVIHRVLNHARVASAPLARGSLVRITGLGLAASIQPVTYAPQLGVPGPTTLDGTSVYFGTTAASLLSAAQNEIVAVVPSSLPSRLATVTVTVKRTVLGSSLTSNALTLPLTAVSPGIYAAAGNGIRDALAFNGDDTPNSADNPALRQDGTIRVRINGFGTTTPSFPDGGLLAGTVFVDNTIQADIDGVAATVLSVAPAPDRANTLEIMVQVPSSLPGPGFVVARELHITVLGASSQDGLTVFVF